MVDDTFKTKNRQYCGGIDVLQGETKEFIFLQGVRPCREVKINSSVTLRPAVCQPCHEDVDKATLGRGMSLFEYGAVAALLWAIDSQIEIACDDPAELAAETWNSLTYALTIGALFGCSVQVCFQSDTQAEAFDSKIEFTRFAA